VLPDQSLGFVKVALQHPDDGKTSRREIRCNVTLHLPQVLHSDLLCADFESEHGLNLYRRQTRNIVNARRPIQDSLNLRRSFLDVIMLGESAGV
jgi:hypothetical protein